VGSWSPASIFAFVLMKLTGVDRQVVEKWVYVEIGLFLFTGLAGTEATTTTGFGAPEALAV